MSAMTPEQRLQQLGLVLPTVSAPRGNFDAYVLDGHTLYLSGSTGGDPATGQLVPGGLEPEFRQIVSNLSTVLAAAGMTMADVVSVTAYLADMNDYAKFNELYRGAFPSGVYPTRSTVAVKDLARGARLELTMIAVRSN